MARFDYQSLITQLSADGFDSGEFVRQLVQRGYQELIDAPARKPTSAPPRTSAPAPARTGATVRVSAPFPPPPATSRSPCPSSDQAVTTPSSWRDGVASTGPCTRS